jgi:hypothetical protein
MRVRRGIRAASTTLVAVALLGVLGACSDDSTETVTSPTPSASSSASSDCADVTALEDSLKALTEVEPLADGTDALNAAIDDVQSDLDAALDSASAELQPQIEDVEAAFAILQDAVTDLTADNLTEKAPEISASLFGLGEATKTLSTSITDNCVTN